MATLTWTGASGGNWGTASNWSSGTVPTAADDVVIDGIGTFDIEVSGPIGTDLSPGPTAVAAHSIVLDDPNAVLDISYGSTLESSGTISLTAGVLFLTHGTIAGGALDFHPGGTFTLEPFQNGRNVLSGVALQGRETLAFGSNVLHIENGLSLQGSGGVGPGNLVLASGGLAFDGDASIAGGTIELAGASLGTDTSMSEIGSDSGTLTIAANAVVRDTGYNNIITGDVLNDGLVTVSTGDRLDLGSPGTLAAVINNGTLNAVPGSTLVLDGRFTNDGTVIDAGAIVEVTSAISFDAVAPLLGAGADLEVGFGATLSNAGTITVGNGAIATLAIDNGGTIAGGVIEVLAGGTVTSDVDSSLAGVTLEIANALSIAGAAVTGGLTLAGVGGVGPVTLSFSDAIDFNGSQTVAGGTLVAGIPGVQGSALSEINGTLTLAAGTGFISEGPSDSITGNVVNQGGVTVAAAARLSVGSGGVFDNMGGLTVAAGGTLVLAGGFENTGSTTINGVVELGGSVTAAQLESDLAALSAPIVMIGTLDNTGGTLEVGAGTALGTLVVGGGGLIENGTIVDTGGGLVVSDGTLSNVAYEGTLTVSGQLTFGTGIGFAGLEGGRGGLDVQDGASAELQNGETLDNVNVQLGGALFGSPYGFTDGTLALGAKAALFETAGAAAQIAASLVNDGTIVALQPGGELSIQSLTNAGLLTVASGGIVSIGGLQNSGSIAVTDGGVLYLGSVANTGVVTELGATLNLNGSITLPVLNGITRSGGIVSIGGTLALGGGTLDVGAGTALGQLRDNGVIDGGTIRDSGSGLVFYGPRGGLAGTLSADAYQGTINMIPAYSSLAVTGGLTMTGASGAGAGAIDLLGAGSLLDFVGSQTFDNAAIDLGSRFDATTLAVSNPTDAAVVLTLGAGASIAQWGPLASIAIDRGLGDGLVNDGVIGAVAVNGAMLIEGGTFTNNGVLMVANGETLNLQADALGNLSAATLSGGNWQVLAGSTLDLGYDNRVAALNAALYLGGPGATVQTFDSTAGQEVTLDQMLQTVGSSGELVLANGAMFDQASVVQDLGHIVLAGGTLEAAPLGLFPNSDLSGAGTIVGAVFDSGIVLAQGGNLVLDGPLYPGGVEGAAWINVGATLTAGSALAVPVWFVGSQGELVLEQANAPVGPISGFTGDDVIDLANVGTAGVSLDFSGGVLTVRTGGNVDATLRFSGFSGSFTSASDGHGGTLIKDPPPLFNAATLTPADLGGTGGGGTAGGIGGTIAVPSVAGMAVGTDQTQGGVMAMLYVGH